MEKKILAVVVERFGELESGEEAMERWEIEETVEREFKNAVAVVAARIKEKAAAE